MKLHPVLAVAAMAAVALTTLQPGAASASTSEAAPAAHPLPGIPSTVFAGYEFGVTSNTMTAVIRVARKPLSCPGGAVDSGAILTGAGTAGVSVFSQCAGGVPSIVTYFHTTAGLVPFTFGAPITTNSRVSVDITTAGGTTTITAYLDAFATPATYSEPDVSGSLLSVGVWPRRAPSMAPTRMRDWKNTRLGYNGLTMGTFPIASGTEYDLYSAVGTMPLRADALTLFNPQGFKINWISP